MPGLQSVTQSREGNGIARACEASLARLGTDHLDLYLLHWPSRGTNLASIVAAFESLRAAGKIRAWGVSSFKVNDMEDLFRVPHGDRCATNQVLYNVGSRGIEHDLLPWCEQRGMPVMAYSPLGGPGASLLRDPTLARIGAAHGCSAAAVALAWTIRSGNIMIFFGIVHQIDQVASCIHRLAQFFFLFYLPTFADGLFRSIGEY
jgi:diketogulonate reductase-like aldo/keto reductase